MGTNEIIRRRALQSGGSAIDWEAEYIKMLQGGSTTLELPSTLTAIREGAFSRYNSLVSIDIPASVTSIGSRAFEGCSNLTSVNYGGNPSLGTFMFSGCAAITDITAFLPNGTTSIISNMFQRCSGLTDVVIPEGVVRVNVNAFYYCTGVLSFSYPSTIQRIDTQEGIWNNAITEIIINATTPPVISNVNYSIGPSSKTFPIYVPDASVDVYKSTTGNWAYFASRIKGISERPVGGGS